MLGLLDREGHQHESQVVAGADVDAHPLWSKIEKRAQVLSQNGKIFACSIVRCHSLGILELILTLTGLSNAPGQARGYRVGWTRLCAPSMGAL